MHIQVSSLIDTAHKVKPFVQSEYPVLAASSTCSILQTASDQGRIMPVHTQSWLDPLGWEGAAAWRPPGTPHGVLLRVNAMKYMNHAQQLAFLDAPKSQNLTTVTTEQWFLSAFSPD